MVNKFAGKCGVCGVTVPANGGNVTRSGKYWVVTHLACKAGQPRVIVTTFGDGTEIYQNSRGRCEDAPCCGCCS